MIKNSQPSARRGAMLALRAYQWLLSPLLPVACRYTPTCSEYAREAVERHGVLRGGLMAAGRVLRCHPFAGSGYDPVQESLTADDRGLTT
jgi:putative membrane protein insertion efficiency factor